MKIQKNENFVNLLKINILHLIVSTTEDIMTNEKILLNLK